MAITGIVRLWLPGLLGLLAVVPARARWLPVAQPTNADLHAVCLLTEGRGWAVGDGGTVLATSDGGATWTPQSSALQTRHSSVHFSSPTVGWVAGEGGEAIQTTDGGEYWRKVTVARDDLGVGPPDSVAPIIPTGELTAWALVRWGDATFLYHTADGGATWDSVRYTDRGYNSPNTLFGMVFTSDSEGWLLAARITGPPQAYIPVFLHTTDGGAHWQTLDAYAAPVDSASTPAWSAAMAAASPANILVHVWSPVRAAGSVFHVVKDPQGFWRQVAIPLDAPVLGIAFPDEQHAWLSGAATWQSIDHAHTFRRTAHPEDILLAADFVGPDTGIAVGSGGRIYRWEEDLPGDVDGSGSVEIADAVLALSILDGRGPTDALSRRLADVDPAPSGDALVTAADAAALLRRAAGL